MGIKARIDLVEGCLRQARPIRARQLTVAAALFLLIGAGQTLGAEPTAAGLWQSLDEDSHQPNAWFLIRDNGGLYEETIVRMFMKPGEDPNVVFWLVGFAPHALSETAKHKVPHEKGLRCGAVAAK